MPRNGKSSCVVGLIFASVCMLWHLSSFYEFSLKKRWWEVFLWALWIINIFMSLHFGNLLLRNTKVWVLLTSFPKVFLRHLFPLVSTAESRGFWWHLNLELMKCFMWFGVYEELAVFALALCHFCAPLAPSPVLTSWIYKSTRGFKDEVSDASLEFGAHSSRCTVACLAHRGRSVLVWKTWNVI